MSIKSKFKTMLKNIKAKCKRDKGDDKIEDAQACDDEACDKTDSELAAEEVIHEEVFPKPARRMCNGRKCDNDYKPEAKAPSKRTRPTNNKYQMIDPDDNTCDSGKS